jgi:serine/threonine protein kinase
VALKEAAFNRFQPRPREQTCVQLAFQQEARLLNRLRHQALPHVIDYFSAGEKQYLVMQFIDGQDLEELLAERKKHPFPAAQVLQWADQLLDVLEYLHGQRTPIIHRDIKPQNLKLTRHGEVVLLDFGLAKGAVSESSHAEASLRGYTHHYAPLEQIEGTGTDPRSDLYALAATLHRLLTGELPAAATARAASLLRGHPDPLPPAQQLNPQVSAAVAAVLTRALALNADERFAAAQEMRQALRQASRRSEQGDPAAALAAAPLASPACFTATQNATAPIARDAQSRVETLALRTVEPEPMPTRLDRAANPGSTYTGQTTPDAASGLRSVSQPPRLEKVSAASNKRRPGLVRLALSVLLFVSAVFAAGDKQQRAAPLAASPRVMVLSYALLVEAAAGRVRTQTDEQPLAAGQQFKLHFTAHQSGYLYLIAPNAQETPTLFLTARPNPAWGVTTNLLAAGSEYSFPPWPDSGLKLTGGAATETYLLVFAPEPLSTPGFFAAAAGRVLTSAEQRELAAWRRRQAVMSRERQGAQTVLTAQSASAPLVFELKLQRQPGRP